MSPKLNPTVLKAIPSGKRAPYAPLMILQALLFPSHHIKVK